MEVSIYLLNINQETTTPASQVIPPPTNLDKPTSQAPSECCVKWGECCVWRNWSDMSMRSKPLSDIELEAHVRSLLTRKEEFGGLAYDPLSGRVLKIDAEGLDAIKLLQEGNDRNGLLNHFGKGKGEDIDNFCAKLVECMSTTASDKLIIE